MVAPVYLDKTQKILYFKSWIYSCAPLTQFKSWRRFWENNWHDHNNNQCDSQSVPTQGRSLTYLNAGRRNILLPLLTTWALVDFTVQEQQSPSSTFNKLDSWSSRRHRLLHKFFDRRLITVNKHIFWRWCRRTALWKEDGGLGANIKLSLSFQAASFHLI